VRAHAEAGSVVFKFRHCVDELVTTSGAVTGVRGRVLELTSSARGKASSRQAVGEFELSAHPMVVTSGVAISESVGARVINPDRMWHYVEGLRNWHPVWDNRGIRILSGPSPLCLDAYRAATARARGTVDRLRPASSPSVPQERPAHRGAPEHLDPQDTWWTGNREE
jgi:predicted oxidoreductase